MYLTETHTHTTKKDSQIAEVTVNYKGGAVIHASEHTDFMDASIDLVAHKLAGMMKKHNEKLHNKRKRQSLAHAMEKGEEYSEEEETLLNQQNEFKESELLENLDQPYRALAVEVI